MSKTIKDILEPIVNMAYRAGKNNDHPNNANIHKVVDTALKELEAIISEQVIGAPLEVDVSWKSTPDDPYGINQLKNQTLTPKTVTSLESYETIKRQYQRLREALYGR